MMDGATENCGVASGFENENMPSTMVKKGRETRCGKSATFFKFMINCHLRVRIIVQILSNGSTFLFASIRDDCNLRNW